MWGFVFKRLIPKILRGEIHWSCLFFSIVIYTFVLNVENLWWPVEKADGAVVLDKDAEEGGGHTEHEAAHQHIHQVQHLLSEHRRIVWGLGHLIGFEKIHWILKYSTTCLLKTQDKAPPCPLVCWPCRCYCKSSGEQRSTRFILLLAVRVEFSLSNCHLILEFQSFP